MATESKAAGLALVQIRSRPLSHPCEFDSLCSSLDVTIGRRPICSIGGTEQSDGSLSEADTDGCIAEDSGYSLTSTGGAELWKGTGDGSYSLVSANPLQQGPTPAATEVWSISWGDFDNDGLLDCVTTNMLAHYNYAGQNDHEALAIQLYRNDGSDAFTLMTVSAWDFTSCATLDGSCQPFYGQTCWADIDADGSLDLLTIDTSYAQAAIIYRNAGSELGGDTWDFESLTLSGATFGGSDRGIAAGDFDGDGGACADASPRLCAPRCAV